MRRLSLVAFLGFSVFLSGCSFTCDLVVVNLSDKPVQVRYRFKGSSHPPAIKAAGELDRDYDWKPLASEQYEMDSHSGTVTVTVAPQTALLLDDISGHMRDDDNGFPISELAISGEYGTVMLFGEQVRKSFEYEAKQVYTINYK